MNRSKPQHPATVVSPAEAVELRKVLVREREAVAEQYLEEVREARGLRDENVEDPVGLASMDIDRDLLLTFGQADRAMVEEIEEALRRLEQGTYGLCQQDGEPIPLDRLREVPWSRYCAAHQKQLEEGLLELSGLS